MHYPAPASQGGHLLGQSPPPLFAPFAQAPAQPDSNGAPLTENHIIVLQLQFIVQKLWETYPADPNVHYYLRHALDLLNMGNIDASADTLHVS